MRLGLERMRLLLAALGSPERSFPAIHVIGTNGKTSTTLYAAAILEAHGLAVGAYISPHVHGFAERVQAHGRPLDEAALAAAVADVERAAAVVDAAADEPLTQFEVLTAAALLALSRLGLDAVVVEAGLGGRHDATNVLAAPVVALTNVALDHVAQLGSTRAAIAAEKLAVVVEGAALVVGASDRELDAIVAGVVAGASVTVLPPPAAGTSYQAANRALASAACALFLGARFRPDLVPGAVAAVTVPGRVERIGERPLVVLDGAHNPHGAAALAAALDDVTERRRPLVGVLAILADKDLDGVLDATAHRLDRIVATASTSDRALAPATIAARVAARGVAVTIEQDPGSALAAARALAGDQGAVIVFGSLSLLADLAATLRETAVS
jgi:dihydrofolate synthase/folylpolyglutamate synthase